MFEISLDTLMKGDKTMVKKFDKELLQNKYIKNLFKLLYLMAFIQHFGIITKRFVKRISILILKN